MPRFLPTILVPWHGLHILVIKWPNDRLNCYRCSKAEITYRNPGLHRCPAGAEKEGYTSSDVVIFVVLAGAECEYQLGAAQKHPPAFRDPR